MRCPRCLQNFYQAADCCPHCGFTMNDADEEYGEESISLKKVCDKAGVLPAKDRERLRKEMAHFEKKFPQLFAAFYTESFEDAASLRRYGFWLLNHAIFTDLEDGRTNDCGILFVMDPNTKSLGVTYGYSLLPYLDEDSTFDILSQAHASLLEGNWGDALSEILSHLTRHLRKKHREVRRDPEGVLGACGQRPAQETSAAESAGDNDESLNPELEEVVSS